MILRPPAAYLSALVLSSAMSVALSTTQVHAQGSLPPAHDIVSRHVAAIGGREAIVAKRSVRTRGTFEMPAASLTGTFDAAQSSVGAMVMRIDLPGVGEIASGFDGEFAWSTNPMIGPRLLRGAEFTQIRDDANFLASLREPPAVVNLQTVGVGEFLGEPCYRVRVSWASGRQTYDCYSMATGLLIGSEVSQLSPTGALDVTVSFADYREFGGIRMATIATQRAAGQEQVLRFTSIEFDAVTTDLFAPPPSVAALIERERSGAQR